MYGLVDAGGGRPLSSAHAGVAVFGEAVFKALSVLVSHAVEGLVVLYK